MTQPLFTKGLSSPYVDEFRARVRRVAMEQVAPLAPDAELAGLFPRAAYQRVAEAGLVRERWEPADHGRGVVIAEELGRTGCGGLAIGISLSMETVASALLRYGTAYHAPILDGLFDGRVLGCLARPASGGSDLSGMRTYAIREGDGWRVRGERSTCRSAGSRTSRCCSAGWTRLFRRADRWPSSASSRCPATR